MTECNASNGINASAETNKKIIKSYFLEMWNKKRTELVNTLVAENYTNHSSDGTITHGRDYVENILEKVFKAFPDIHLTIKLMVAEDDMVATYIEGKGTQLGGDENPESTGKVIHFKEAFYHRIKDGMVTEGWAITPPKN